MNSRGDTIVEVLLATVVISIVIAGAFSLSRRAGQVNQTAYEKTAVSHQMIEYAELIRETRNVSDTSAAWDAIIDSPSQYADGSAVSFVSCTPTGGKRPFIINPAFFGASPSVTTSDANFYQSYNGSTDSKNDLYQVWAEAVDNGTHVDVYIRACWDGIGSETEQRSSLVVRLEV